MRRGGGSIDGSEKSEELRRGGTPYGSEEQGVIRKGLGDDEERSIGRTSGAEGVNGKVAS